MAETPGICTQTTTCEVARSGRSVTVPLGSPFVCSECGRGLVAPIQASEPMAQARMPLSVPMSLVGAGLLVLGGAVFLGRELGSAGAPLAAPSAATSAAPAPAPAAVASLVPKPVPPGEPAAVPAPAKMTAVAAPSPAAPAAVSSPPPTPPDATPPAVAAGLPPGMTAADLPAAPSTGAPAAPVPLALTTTRTPLPGAGGPAGAASPPSVLQAAPGSALASKAAAPPQEMIASRPTPPPPAPAAMPAKLAATLPPQAQAAPAVPDQPFSPVPVSGGAPTYPAEFAADGRPGRVAVTCQIQPDGAPAACRAVAGKGGAPFAAATLAWLNHAHVRYRPVILHGHAIAVAKAWTVTLEEPAAMLADARRKQSEDAKGETASAAPDAPRSAPLPLLLPVQPIVARQIVPQSPEPAAIDRPFSTRIVAGGAPTFPASYDEARPGSVTVSCTIGKTGAPSGCRVLKATGGAAFGRSVQSWLGSGNVRFRPVTAGGQPVSRDESWTIVFNRAPEVE